MMTLDEVALLVTEIAKSLYWSIRSAVEVELGQIDRAELQRLEQAVDQWCSEQQPLFEQFNAHMGGLSPGQIASLRQMLSPYAKTGKALQRDIHNVGQASDILAEQMERLGRHDEAVKFNRLSKICLSITERDIVLRERAADVAPHVRRIVINKRPFLELSEYLDVH